MLHPPAPAALPRHQLRQTPNRARIARPPGTTTAERRRLRVVQEALLGAALADGRPAAARGVTHGRALDAATASANANAGAAVQQQGERHVVVGAAAVDGGGAVVHLVVVEQVVVAQRGFGVVGHDVRGPAPVLAVHGAESRRDGSRVQRALVRGGGFGDAAEGGFGRARREGFQLRGGCLEGQERGWCVRVDGRGSSGGGHAGVGRGRLGVPFPGFGWRVGSVGLEVIGSVMLMD